MNHPKVLSLFQQEVLSMLACKSQRARRRHEAWAALGRPLRELEVQVCWKSQALGAVPSLHLARVLAPVFWGGSYWAAMKPVPKSNSVLT